MRLNSAIDFFHPNVCHVCKITSRETELKRCAQCYLISYCGQPHQKIQWKIHKELCRVLSRVLIDITSIMPSKMNCIKFRSAVLTLCEIKLERPLTWIEINIVHFHKFCSICGTREQLSDCSVCLSRYFCPDHLDFLTVHKLNDDCPQLLLNLEAHLAKSKPYYWPAFAVRPSFVPHNNMDDFITKNIDLGDEINKFLNKMLVSDLISRPLTVLYAVSILRLPFSDSLNIHIVGSNNFELETACHWDVLCTALDLRHLHLTFIGPEMDGAPCASHGNMTVQSSSAFYHEYQSETPDLVVVFNCGLHEFEDNSLDTWGPSLVRVLSRRVPVVLTSYTVAESVQDVARLVRVASAMRVRQFANPYASLSPLRDAESLGVYFVNSVLSLVCPAEDA